MRGKISLQICDLLPTKTRVLLLSDVRREVIREAATRFGGMKKLADFLGVNQKVPRWWENGKCRPSIKQLRMLEVSHIIADAESFGLEGSKKDLKLPKEITFDETFAWFLGLRAGDSDETYVDVGIGNSDSNILQKAMQFFRKFFIDKEQLWLYVWVIEPELDSAKERWSKELGVPTSRITAYKARDQKKDYIKMRFSSLLFRLIVDGIQSQIDVILQNSPVEVKAAYVRGFFDAEGCVEDFGIILNQRTTKKGLDNLRRLDQLLKELGISHGGIKYTNQTRFAYIRISASPTAENLMNFRNSIGFSSESKSRKLSELIQIYKHRSLTTDKDLLGKMVVAWLNNVDGLINRFDVMRTFNLRISTTRRVMNSLIDKGKIEATKVGRKWTYKV